MGQKTKDVQKLAIIKKSTFSCLILMKLFEVSIITKFHKDKTKNVDFLLMPNFLMCLIFQNPDFTMLIHAMILLSNANLKHCWAMLKGFCKLGG